jgi:hypothetical protein
MKNRGSTWGIVLVLGAFVISGCGTDAAQLTEISPVAQTALPTAVPTGAVPAAPDPRSARDIALAYIVEHYDGPGPAPDLAWVEEVVTPEGLVGSSTYQYAAGEWVVTVSFPIAASDATSYQVVAVDQSTAFQWEGSVDAAGQVMEAPVVLDELEASFVPENGQPVITAWFGNVVSLPAGAQYDDYLALQPEGAGEIGLTGADEAIEAQIEVLRDKEEPGKYAHFWGTLTCGVPEYGGCQLVVSRMRVGQAISGPEPVEAWEGTIVGNPPGSQFDDYLILAGGFPVGFGIAGYGADGPDPALAAQLEGLRDTGVRIRVWGQIISGVPDAFGSQIQATRIEVEGPSPVEPATSTVDGWLGTIFKLPPGNQHGGYFERDDGQRFGIGATDDAVMVQIQETQWTGVQVQVWGQLHTGVPSVKARHIDVERIKVVSGPSAEARNLSPFASPSVSSALPSDRGGTYHAFSAIDGLLESSWVEGVTGLGAGEWIVLDFPEAIEVHSIGLDVGFDRDADIFAKNNRIKRATFTFSSGEVVTLDFADVRGMQSVPLVRAPGPNIETTFVKMVIEEVYPGSQYDDTCLAEIEVWGRTRFE